MNKLYLLPFLLLLFFPSIIDATSSSDPAIISLATKSINSILYSRDPKKVTVGINLLDSNGNDRSVTIAQFWDNSAGIVQSNFNNEGRSKITISSYGKTITKVDSSTIWNVIPPILSLDDKFQPDKSIFDFPKLLLMEFGNLQRSVFENNVPISTSRNGDICTIHRHYDRNTSSGYSSLDDVLNSGIHRIFFKKGVLLLDNVGNLDVSANFEIKSKKLKFISAKWPSCSYKRNSKSIVSYECVLRVENAKDAPVIPKSAETLLKLNENKEHILQRTNTLLPKGWKITDFERDVAPYRWNGPLTGFMLTLKDTNTRFQDRNMGFYYSPFLSLWFCPIAWDGIAPKYSPVAQDYPAKYLGKNQENKVYYQTIGQTTWTTWEKDVIKAFNLTIP
jgi:hypothetical protein